MSDSDNSDPVIGDRVITLPGEHEMTAVDLPDSVAVQLMTETVGNIQRTNAGGRDTASIVSGALQAGIAKTLNELGPVESRAVSGVMATPIASPTTG